MHRIPCPFCGPRDESEFRYRGDAGVQRPVPTMEGDPSTEDVLAYVYERTNPCGWHLEWWQHAHGCRRVLKVRRHTLSHVIAWAGWPTDQPPPPPEDGP